MAIQIDKIIRNLEADYSLKSRGKYHRHGICPSCSKKTLFIETENPFNLKCGRENKCAWQMKTRELYPDCFKKIEDAYPPTPANPNATADAYLKSRGFEIKPLKGQYQQQQKVEHKALSRLRNSTETVRVNVGSGYWERYITSIEMEDGLKKSNFGGQRKQNGSIYKGNWANPPMPNDYRAGQKIFLTEGIFDMWSLTQSGKDAHALMSCYNYPEEDIKEHYGKKIHWVIALDNDKAGIKYAKIWFKKLKALGEEVSLCIAPEKEKKDWNDHLLESKKQVKTEAAKIPATVFEAGFYNGSLLTAISAMEKAHLIFDKERAYRNKFTFEFNQQVFWAQYSSKDDEGLQISRVCNCFPQFLYFQCDIITRESLYFISTTRKGNNRIYKEEFLSPHIASAQRFKEKLLDAGPGLHFKGNNAQLANYLDDFWFNDPNPPQVSSINFVGYAKEFKAWIFSKQCIHDGKMYSVNQEDYFDLNSGQQVKTSYKVEPLVLSENNKPELWYQHFKTAYGLNGLAALAYWFGTFFAEQMRVQIESWPFLELSGKAGTGKTKLLEFLWKLTGRENYEGVDLAKATNAGRWRTFSQLANLPTVLIEGDRHSDRGHQSQQFDMNEAKPLYNGRGMRITGEKTGGNETKEPPFRSALIVAQNAMVDADEAVMERICHLHFDKSTHTAEGERAVNALIDLDIGDINGFLTEACKNETAVLEQIKECYQGYMQSLAQIELGEKKHRLKNRRIRHNFAQIMACAETMSEMGIVPMSQTDLDQLFQHLVKRAWARHQAIRSDHPMIEEFFEIVDYLESTRKGPNNAVNHHVKDGWIAINFPQFNNYAKSLGQHIGNNQIELKKILKQSIKRYEYQGYKTIKSAITHKNTKCFIFKSKESAYI